MATLSECVFHTTEDGALKGNVQTQNAHTAPMKGCILNSFKVTVDKRTFF